MEKTSKPTGRRIDNRESEGAKRKGADFKLRTEKCRLERGKRIGQKDKLT